MNIEMIEKTVEKIESCKGDFEVAHNIEDGLFHAFVEYVSYEGDEKLRKMALAVLKSKAINFPRHCA